MSISYSERIPNNVSLSDNRRLQRALEAWQPAYINWWQEMGPEGAQADSVYLRTAVSVDRKGWAQFDYTKMPDYRWGIFLAEPDEDRRIGFGEHKGEKVWQEVPGEYRAALRRLIVIQGDTEPASVEQQRYLGQTCPSLYDLRNLFQINVEEGRHLWAMAYLLHAHFGRDGREEAEGLLTRRSGDEDKPRMLGAFNEQTPDWLSFFMFTFFTDRDGKFQLSSLTESAFDPLARSAKFMLTEEAHHMFVGITGLTRVVQRTCEVMNELKLDLDQVREHGVIDLPTFQKYLNFHYSVTLDLFGAEVSSNAAAGYSGGLKGRFRESLIDDDHGLDDAAYPVLHWSEQRGGFAAQDVPALNALNERLRDDYVADVEDGIRRLNNVLREQNVDFEFCLPHRAFNRHIGLFKDLSVTPQGQNVTADAWRARQHDWLPSERDRSYVRSLMTQAVTEPGKFAHWIAPPSRGINGMPVEHEYVRFA